VLRTVNDGPTLWESVIPQCLLGLPGDLAEIDRLLDDGRFFEPFRPFFDRSMGRPSVPIETYLRLMFLKYRYRLGFEPLCREVADSLAWRRFCRIPLGASTPHPTTLMKITSRCGESAITQLNEVLLAKAHDDKLVRLDRVRADTTVVAANVAYPTDSGLLAKGVARLAALTRQLRAAGLATRTKTRDRTRSVRCRAHAINMWLRRRNGGAKDEVLTLTAEIAAIARRSVGEARHVARNARRGARTAGMGATSKTVALIAQLERTAELVERVCAQTRVRLRGDVPDGATRIVSLHDSDARPIAKGKLGQPVEFGYKAQVLDNTDGIVLDHEVRIGNPHDGPMLAPAIARIKARFGNTPRAVTADRGYGEAAVERDLHILGVKRVAIPRRGKPGGERQHHQRARGFVKLMKWRTGCEARISCLKRDYGWRRTGNDGLAGASTWCAWGVLTHNATKIVGLQRAAPPATRTDVPAGTSLPNTTGPPGRQRTANCA
jgi:IS5 family transposase